MEHCFNEAYQGEVMRRWIEIEVAPRGFGIQQWIFPAFVGVVMPVLSEAEVSQLSAGMWIGPELDEQGFVVSICEVIVSLRAERASAADFWQAASDAGQAQYVRFERSVCKLVAGPSIEQTPLLMQKW